MKRGTMQGMLVLGAVGLALLAGGCNEREQILALQNKNEALMEENKNCRDQIIELERQNAQYKSDCDMKDQQLATKNEELAQLRARKDTGGPTASGWQRTTFGDKIAVGSDLLFASGRATLTSDGQRALDPIVRDLQGQYRGLPIRVYGYTDSDPIKKTKNLWKDNLDLSANRAMAVTRYLISRGVPAQEIETIAMGATHFVSDNKSRDGKKKNRRVEIFVVKMN
ncbi:MAG: OmpA family protein [Phycisphaerae bacterium]|nr:OmpA family protein [Phycisphaerae bacterium]